MRRLLEGLAAKGSMTDLVHRIILDNAKLVMKSDRRFENVRIKKESGADAVIADYKSVPGNNIRIMATPVKANSWTLSLVVRARRNNNDNVAEETVKVPAFDDTRHFEKELRKTVSGMVKYLNVKGN